MRVSSAFPILLCFLSLLAPVGGWAGTGSFSPSGEAAKETIRSRRFQDRRDLMTYLKELPPEFGDALMQLGPEDRLLDGGAGALYFAEQVVSLAEFDAATSPLNPPLNRKL